MARRITIRPDGGPRLWLWGLARTDRLDGWSHARRCKRLARMFRREPPTPPVVARMTAAWLDGHRITVCAPGWAELETALETADSADETLRIHNAP